MFFLWNAPWAPPARVTSKYLVIGEMSDESGGTRETFLSSLSSRVYMGRSGIGTYSLLKRARLCVLQCSALGPLYQLASEGWIPGRRSTPTAVRSGNINLV